MDALSLLAVAHHSVLSLLADVDGQHFQGLHQAKRYYSLKLSSKTAKQIEQLDVAYAVARHITSVSTSRLLSCIRDELGSHDVAKRQISGSDADSRAGLDFSEADDSYGVKVNDDDAAEEEPARLAEEAAAAAKKAAEEQAARVPEEKAAAAKKTAEEDAASLAREAAAAAKKAAEEQAARVPEEEAAAAKKAAEKEAARSAGVIPPFPTLRPFAKVDDDEPVHGESEDVANDRAAVGVSGVGGHGQANLKDEPSDYEESQEAATGSESKEEADEAEAEVDVASERAEEEEQSESEEQSAREGAEVYPVVDFLCSAHARWIVETDREATAEDVRIILRELM